MGAATQDATLKTYCKSVLRIEVELAVCVAEKPMRVEEILEIVPGAMLQFEKPCTTPLTVEVGGHSIATGEVVKIGDKFGIRIKEILKPGERYIALTSSSRSASD